MSHDTPRPHDHDPKQFRPLHPTAKNIDNIKAQFAQHASNKVVVQGANYSKAPEQEVSEEQLAEERKNIPFYPFPESGNICEYVQNPTHPGIFVVVVNIESDPSKPVHPGFFATTRQSETAQMICDGINFLYKCQKQMEQVGAGEVVQPTILPPVKVDLAPEWGNGAAE